MLKNRTKQKEFSHFKNFIKLPIDVRTSILELEFKEDEVADINAACDALPNYEVEVKTFVEGFDDLLVGDNMTIRVIINRLNIEENKVFILLILGTRSSTFNCIS